MDQLFKLRHFRMDKRRHDYNSWLVMKRKEEREREIAEKFQKRMMELAHLEESQRMMKSAFLANPKKRRIELSLPHSSKPKKRKVELSFSCLSGMHKQSVAKKWKMNLFSSDSMKKTKPTGIEEIEDEMQAIYEAFIAKAGKDFTAQNEITLPLVIAEEYLDIGSLKRLWPFRWINDTLLNFYGVFLKKVKFDHCDNKVLVLTTYFYESLLKFVSGVSTLRRVQRPRTEDLFQKEVILIPCNVLDSTHWILLAIFNPDLIEHSIDTKRILVNDRGNLRVDVQLEYDASMNNKNSNSCYIAVFDSLHHQYPELVDNIKFFLSKEFERLYDKVVDMTNIQSIHVDCVRQLNQVDCGIFTLYNEEKILEHLSQYLRGDCTNHFSTDEVRFKRVKILVNILTFLELAKE